MFRCVVAIVGTVVHQMIRTVTSSVNRTIFSGVIIGIVSDSHNIDRILIVFALRRIIGLSTMLWQIFSLECFKIYSDAFRSQFPGLPLNCFCNFFPPPCSVLISSLLKTIKNRLLTRKLTFLLREFLQVVLVRQNMFVDEHYEQAVQDLSWCVLSSGLLPWK